ncbi:hypothetical protein BU16DRAFT_579285 [Lophium mytilinum]|uniref:RING-type E3 ubiquitin transferase n=1 Tax=Lophium mytilinum TaxID=390894 RepID=A0A6A6R5X3_9PEZI|nr:hypothetical protein BU16DRAFT_579285 [Lophium mytilinum]
MASTTDTSTATTAPGDTNTTPRNPRGRGGGPRGGPRGGTSDQGFTHAANNDRGRGGRRGRNGRGRGRGQGERPSEDHVDKPPPVVPPPPLPDLNRSVPRPSNGEQNLTQDGGEAGDSEVEECWICASPVVHTALTPCNHRTCHICSLRLRALYKTKDCAHCRTEGDFVIFTDDATKRYEDFAAADISSSDDNLGIRYENVEIYEDTVLLLRYNCPDPSCDVACLGWPDLHRHVRTIHQKAMCDLCTRHKKVFTHEHELFTPSQLKTHQKFGDDNPGAVDQSGFKGHPECGFCRQRFYGDDELYTHCRDKHERCHICDRQSNGRKPQYYVDYNSLEVHFRKNHFLCPDSECLEKKFVVFDSQLDLKAHQLQDHPEGLSKDARRDARRVDMSGFQLRAPHEPERGGRREGRGRGRGRDPNAEALPASSAQPLRRDELAYQRQMAIQNAQSFSGRSFGGQLTSSDAFAARAPPGTQEPSTVTAPRPVTNTNTLAASVGGLQLGSNTRTPVSGSPPQETALSPQDQARRQRHSAVTERASNMLNNEASKMGQFRTKVSSFRTSSITATELIEAFFILFDASSADLGKLIKELADIFEVGTKKDDLLRAWSDWKAINEDYPSLPGGAVQSLRSGSTGHGGSRVLKLKTSTAQSSQSALSRQGSWGSSNSPVFPALSSSAASGSRGAASRPGTTPWATSGSNRPSPAPTRTVSQVPSSSNVTARASEAFPALPAAVKPRSTLFSPGYGGGSAVRRENGNATGNAWGAGTGSASGGQTPPDRASEEDVAGGNGQKKKGNKNKKQTLFHFG